MTARLLTRPPDRAGKAKVVFDDSRGWKAPGLVDGDTVVLPWNFRNLEVFSLQGGEQMVALAPDGTTAFFGTDEQPFAVTLQPEHGANLLTGGEDAFYAGLKPHIMWLMERYFPGVADRQGDIWYFRLPFDTWDELAMMHHFETWGVYDVSDGVFPLFGTRHDIHGRISVGETNLHIFQLSPGAVGSGILTAPDHADRDLTSGPYFFARTPGTSDREELAPGIFTGE